MRFYCLIRNLSTYLPIISVSMFTLAPSLIEQSVSCQRMSDRHPEAVIRQPGYGEAYPSTATGLSSQPGYQGGRDAEINQHERTLAGLSCNGAYTVDVPGDYMPSSGECQANSTLTMSPILNSPRVVRLSDSALTSAAKCRWISR